MRKVMTSKLSKEQENMLDAATFRRFLNHLDNNKDVQNIDLMILANFCRNCLGKWYKAEADKLNIQVTDEEAKERIYGMPYNDWKINHQVPATEEQMKAFNAKK